VHTQITLKKRLIIHLSIGLAMFLGSAIAAEPAHTEQAPVSEEALVVESEQPEQTTEEIVRAYFKDIPIMADVAYCESRFRQYNESGTPLRGIQNSQDVGVMQINEKYHRATAEKLGHNIDTLEGNLDYARFLFEQEGTGPWKYSSPCWGKTREVALNG
jgi:hypothetical protein